ncbi:hypothetical protein [Halobacterium salinarum]|uniref:hypothetical protein n=1 Tax=Halobacterium salinarum TaxID=2242 RepID=UPI001F21C785|nr:hypothetical protein [Halobacterium salinarum]MCF2165390.1 hypothetical protein [Halobacterium salinarum]MCF2168250.1 hypothetical protein [Halobacterium salinarum]
MPIDRMEEPGTVVPSADSSNRRLGPHRVPRIACGKCGHEHHIDATTGEHQGRCSECWAFLRRPTNEETKKFSDFMDWKARHAERDADYGGMANA